MRWRKITAAMLSAGILLTLSACGSSDSSEETESTETDAEETVEETEAEEEAETAEETETSEETEEAEAEEETGTAEETNEEGLTDAEGEEEVDINDEFEVVVEVSEIKETVDDSGTGEEEESSSFSDVTIEEQILYEQDDVVISATGISFDDSDMYLELFIENNSNEAIIVQTEFSSVNGYTVSSELSSDVAARESMTDNIIISTYQLEIAGIDTVSEVEFYFYITNQVTNESEVAGPVTITTSAYGSYTQTYDDSGTVLYDANGIRIILKEFENITYSDENMDTLMGRKQQFLYIENNSDQNIYVEAADITVNGYPFDDASLSDATFSTYILAGKKKTTFFLFYDYDLNKMDITDITLITSNISITEFSI